MLTEKPFFSICGAPKLGTTSLYAYLDQHPEVCMSDPKETDFFQRGYDRGLVLEYLSLNTNFFCHHMEGIFFHSRETLNTSIKVLLMQG
jgi:hypothetical protein